MTGTIVTAEEVYNILRNAGIRAPLMILDEEYHMPTRKWVETTFAEAFTSMVKQMDYTYRSNSRDCDDFSRFACWYMSYLQSRMKAEGEKAILAGEFGYYAPDLNPPFGGYHAIVMIITRDAPELPKAAVFYEPQPILTDYKIEKVCMTERKLEPEDVGSCIYCRV